jgi:hypothetical protein
LTRVTFGNFRKLDEIRNGVDCSRPKWFHASCATGHVRKKLLRCRKCDWCIDAWARQKRWDLMMRYEENIDKMPEEVTMWTAGTNWKYTDENYKKIKRCYQLFMKRVRKQGRHQVLLRVFELGSKGGYLHVHWIANTDHYIAQKYWRGIWSEITGVVNPNFGYARRKQCVHCDKIVKMHYRYHCQDNQFKKADPRRAMMYLTKYLSKENQKVPGGGRMKTALYVGKSMWYSWKNIEGQKSLANWFGGEGINRIKQKKGQFIYRWLVTGTIGGVSYDSNIEWRDMDLKCKDKDCPDKLVIKAMEFERNLTEEVYNIFGKERGDLLLREYEELKKT